jgi:hypothetical protein
MGRKVAAWQGGAGDVLAIQEMAETLEHSRNLYAARAAMRPSNIGASVLSTKRGGLERQRCGRHLLVWTSSIITRLS